MNRIEDFDTNHKQNHPHVGEQTLREDYEDTPASESKDMSVKTVLAGALSLQ